MESDSHLPRLPSLSLVLHQVVPSLAPGQSHRLNGHEKESFRHGLAGGTCIFQAPASCNLYDKHALTNPGKISRGGRPDVYAYSHAALHTVWIIYIYINTYDYICTVCLQNNRVPQNFMVHHCSNCNWVVCRIFVTYRNHPWLATCDTICCHRLLHILGSKRGSRYGHQWLLTLQAAKEAGQKEWSQTAKQN